MNKGLHDDKPSGTNAFLRLCLDNNLPIQYVIFIRKFGTERTLIICFR